jgi:hypothetical protein
MEFQANDGGGFFFHMLHCDQCGREKSAVPCFLKVKATIYPRWFVVLAVVLGLVALVGAFAGYDGLARRAPAKLLVWGGFGSGAVALLAMFGAGVLTKRQVTVDWDGIEVRGGTGKTTRITWAEAHDFHYRAVTDGGEPGVLKAALSTPDGRRIAVDDVRGQDAELTGPAIRLPELVEQYSTMANWAKIEARVRAAETLEFGPVRIDGKHLFAGSLAVSMDHPVALQVEKGLIKVGADGSWQTSRVAAMDVPNYPCLLRAIGQVTRARQIHKPIPTRQAHISPKLTRGPS